MGTANFHNVNASKTFALEIEDEFDSEVIFYNISEMLKEAGFDTFKSLGKAPRDNDRNFPGIRIGQKSQTKFYGEAEIFVTVRAILRGGYYSGANLDWEYDIEMGCLVLQHNGWGGYQYHGEPDYDIESILRMDFNMNAGMAKIQAKNATYFIDKALEDLTDQLETIYKKVSQPLKVKCRASNGETMYESA